MSPRHEKMASPLSLLESSDSSDLPEFYHQDVDSLITSTANKAKSSQMGSKVPYHLLLLLSRSSYFAGLLLLLCFK